MNAEPLASWPAPSRRRRAVGVLLDFYFLWPPTVLLLLILSFAAPSFEVDIEVFRMLVFLVAESILLFVVRWSPGWMALGIRMRPDPSSALGAPDRKVPRVVDPWVLANERWWTILPSVYLVEEGTKLLGNSLLWHMTFPFLGLLLEGVAAAAFHLAFGALALAAGMGILRLRGWGVWAGAAFELVMLATFAPGGAAVAEYVRRMAERPVTDDRVRFVATWLSASFIGMLAWLAFVAVRIRFASHSRDSETSGDSMPSSAS